MDIDIDIDIAVAASKMQRLIWGALVIGPRTNDLVGLKTLDYAICGRCGQ